MVCKWNEEKDSMHTYHQMMTMNYQDQELKMTKKRELNYWKLVTMKNRKLYWKRMEKMVELPQWKNLQNQLANQMEL